MVNFFGTWVGAIAFAVGSFVLVMLIGFGLGGLLARSGAPAGVMANLFDWLGDTWILLLVLYGAWFLSSWGKAKKSNR